MLAKDGACNAFEPSQALVLATLITTTMGSVPDHRLDARAASPPR
jgi:hypothetical protein